MAIATFNYSSQALKKQTEVKVCFPDMWTDFKDSKDRKVLWLLHGLSDDSTCWTRFSQIERYASEYGITVIMPDGGRSMYCDGVYGQNTKELIVKELPEYFHRIIGISNARENNFIAGLSMGGMGAAKIALGNPDKYFGFGSFSGLLDIKCVEEDFRNSIDAEFPFMKPFFKDGSTEDPKTMLDKTKHADMKMFVACGNQDYWIKAAKSFKEKSDALGMDVKYIFENGGHEWALWDRNVKRCIEYMVMGY